jgi:nucleoside-diphosphate-sugar epimerase
VQVARALAGVEAVVHVAGRAHDRRTDPIELQRVNVDAARVCAEVAASEGVLCFVLVSSLGAVAHNDAGRVDDATPPAPTGAYGRSKLQGEEAVMRVAREAGLRAPILRPPMVYGPRMKGNPLRLFHLVARGVPIPVDAVQNARSILYVGNLAAAITAVLMSPTVGTERFLVSDDGVVSTPELVRRIARALGRPARLVAVPASILRVGAVFGDFLARFGPFPLTSKVLDGLIGTLVVDDSTLRRTTGFVPPFSIDEGLRSTADWFKAFGARS